MGKKYGENKKNLQMQKNFQLSTLNSQLFTTFAPAFIKAHFPV